MTNNLLFAIIVIPLFIAGCIYFDWSIEKRYKDYQCKYNNPDTRDDLPMKEDQ